MIKITIEVSVKLSPVIDIFSSMGNVHFVPHHQQHAAAAANSDTGTDDEGIHAGPNHVGGVNQVAAVPIDDQDGIPAINNNNNGAPAGQPAVLLPQNPEQPAGQQGVPPLVQAQIHQQPIQLAANVNPPQQPAYVLMGQGAYPQNLVPPPLLPAGPIPLNNWEVGFCRDISNKLRVDNNYNLSLRQRRKLAEILGKL